MVSLVFTRSDTWLGKAIRLVTRSEVNHVAFFYYDLNFGRFMVLEAGKRGFNLAPAPPEHEIYWKFPLNLSEPQVFPKLTGWLNKGYDYPGLVGELWVQFMRFFHKKVSNPLASSKNLFCSEAATMFLQKIQYPGSEELDPSATSPADLFEFLQQSSK
jgi:hypothetical protein